MHKKIEEEFYGLPENFIVLTVVKSGDSEKANLAMLNYLVNNKGYKGSFVAVSRPYKTMVNIMADNSIDTNGIFFIDCISKDIGRVTDAHNCIYIDSPQHLTDLGIAIEQLFNMKHGEFILIDSINTLFIYNDRERLAKFLHFLSNKIRVHELKGVMVSMQEGTDPILMSEISQFCDKVIDLTEY